MSTYHHGDLPAALLRAAGRTLEKRGIGALSLRDTARQAGVSHNAPYRHFSDREALLAALAAEGFAMLGERLRGAHGSVAGETPRCPPCARARRRRPRPSARLRGGRERYSQSSPRAADTRALPVRPRAASRAGAPRAAPFAAHRARRRRGRDRSIRAGNRRGRKSRPMPGLATRPAVRPRAPGTG